MLYFIPFSFRLNQSGTVIRGAEKTGMVSDLSPIRAATCFIYLFYFRSIASFDVGASTQISYSSVGFYDSYWSRN